LGAGKRISGQVCLHAGSDRAITDFLFCTSRPPAMHEWAPRMRHPGCRTRLRKRLFVRTCPISSGSPPNGLSGYRPCCSRFLRRPSIAPALPMSRRSNHSWLTKLLLTRIVCEGSHAIRQGPCGFAHDRVGRDRGRLYGMTRFCNPCLCLWRFVIGLRTIDLGFVYPTAKPGRLMWLRQNLCFWDWDLLPGSELGLSLPASRLVPGKTHRS